MRRVLRGSSNYVDLSVGQGRLSGLSAPYPSKRREKFEPAVRALNGKPIGEGRFTLAVDFVSVEPKDVALRARREDVPKL